MIPSVSVAPAAEKFNKKPGKREVALLLMLAWITPLSFRLISGNSPVPFESSVLPLFGVTLAAVYLYGAAAGLFVGLSAPLIEYLVIGFPDTPSIAWLAIRVAVFVGLARGLIRLAPGSGWVAPFAYVVATAVTVLLRTLGNAGPAWPSAGQTLLSDLQIALPGMALLAFVHFVLVKLRPQPDDWDAT